MIYERSRHDGRGLAAWSAKDATRWPAFQATLRRLGALIGSLVHAPRRRRSIRPSARDVVRADADARRLPRRCRRTISGGCCGGVRWRWRIWSANRSTPSCCARRSRRTASSARCSARGRPAADCSCCSRMRIARWRGRPVASSPADRWRWHAHLKRPRGRFGVEIRTGIASRAHRGQRRSRVGGHPGRRRAHRSARRGVRRRSEAHVSVALRCRSPAAGIPVADEALPVARHAREGQPRAVGVAVVHRRHSRDARAAASGWRPISIISSARSITRSTDASRRIRGSSSRFRRSTIRHSRRRRARACRPTRSLRRIHTAGTADWDASTRRRSATPSSSTLVAVRAGHRIVDRRATGADAARSRARLGPDRRSHLPRRAVARSVLHHAAAARLWPVSHADQGPVSLRIGLPIRGQG